MTAESYTFGEAGQLITTESPELVVVAAELITSGLLAIRYTDTNPSGPHP